MEFKAVIQKRKSVRNFTDEPVPSDVIKEIVKAASLAPSIAGSELCKFIAITNKTVLSEMSEIVKTKYSSILPRNDERITENIKIAIEKFSTLFTSAPVTVVVLTKPYTAVIDRILTDTAYSHSDINKLRNHPDIQSVGAAIENALLTAVNLGYGACWLTGPMIAREELSKVLGIEDPLTLAAFFVIGKPAEDNSAIKEKDINELLSFIE